MVVGMLLYIIFETFACLSHQIAERFLLAVGRWVMMFHLSALAGSFYYFSEWLVFP